MKARELVGTARIPGGADLRLFRHGDDYFIMVNTHELMSSRVGGSEEALAVMTFDRLGSISRPHLLIGGYGMGFTLRAALRRAGDDARLTVAELVPEVIEWARGPMSLMTGGCLDDPRVRLVTGDVAAAIGAATSTYDGILLDVDNGPSGLIREVNDGLYSVEGLATAKRALRPRGILAVWSAAPDTAFARRLRDAGFATEEVTVRARANGKGPRHTIWFARRS
jgi:spermidine synthase